jgi:hypothetical protein
VGDVRGTDGYAIQTGVGKNFVVIGQCNAAAIAVAELLGGIEIEIDENSEYLSKVEYQVDRPTMQLEKLMRDFCGKMFAQMDMSNVSKDPTLLPLVVQPYITKAKDWEHEREYRLIYLENDFIKEGFKKCVCSDDKERYFCPIKITKVFCGASMSEDNKKALRDIIPSEIEMVEMQISGNKYELMH